MGYRTLTRLQCLQRWHQLLVVYVNHLCFGVKTHHLIADLAPAVTAVFDSSKRKFEKLCFAMKKISNFRSDLSTHAPHAARANFKFQV